MTTTRATRTRPSPGPRRRARPHPLRGWLAFLLPLLAIAALGVAFSLTETDEATVTGTAPDFTLPDTDGGTFALADALDEGDTLLYFSMGVGCDGCFAQIPEISDALADRGIRLASIMVDPAPAVASEADRFGIRDPILIDADRTVSRAYGMLGVYGHADRPSHSFALVHPDGTVGRVEHYATMFVPLDQLVRDLGLPAS